jgi:peptidoglycan/LPS O-acetylase OafA/YrhL
MLPQKNYLPVLDGLRGLAILVVVISHYGFGKLIPGGFGVTLFFFISGFLITRLLIVEWAKTGRIDLTGFYLRRLFRLYPALLFMVALATGFLLASGCGLMIGDLLSTLFYYRNYYMLYGGSTASFLCRQVFNITWSLAIEEHFYLLFPFLFIAGKRRLAALAGVMVIIIVAVACWRLYIIDTNGLTELTIGRIYNLTDTRIDAIMFGCLVSVLVRLDTNGQWLRRSTHPAWVAGALALLLFTFLYRNSVFRESWRYSLQGLSLCILVTALVYNQVYTRLARRLSAPWLVTIGKLSYSLYLFHWLGMCVANRLIGEERLSVDWLATAVPIGLLLSIVSYNYVEKPTASLRRRFGSTVNTSNPVNNQPPPIQQPSIS